jgi:pimeloyl-ACP methyl ester carboxylesterase
MPEPVHLDLKDSENRPLRHKYLCHTDASEGLFFQLPGDNYGADGPLLYLPARLLFSDGWDTFSLSYGYQSAGKSFAPEHIPAIVGESAGALETVLQGTSYSKVVLAGKSLGAAVIAVLLTMGLELHGARAIYLTPPLGTPVFDPVFINAQAPAYIAMGTADRFYDETGFNELLAKRDFEYTLIEDADHSLYVEGDLQATLSAHERITRAAIAFAQG